MGSSSSSTTSITHIQQKYDVFISFRGTDTRDNITSHVYDALRSAKIETFIDNDLHRGDDVSDALLRTIADSKISLIIFSENYGSSRWCLDELVKIMECNKENGQIVIPVFFKVDPTHVRNQSGPFGQALARYEGHPKIQTWRKTLTKAGNLSGWDSQVIRPEATLVKRIVKDILDKLSSCTLGNLVGMSSHFFNHNISKFVGYCLIENIRGTCEKKGLNELPDKLVTERLKDEKLNVGTPNLGIPFIRDMLRRKKVLIVLDDVNDFQHVELSVGQSDFFGTGSIIIRTRATFRIFTIADPKFSMSIRNGKVILASANSNDPNQEWYKDEKYARGVTNQMHHKAFALVNKGTGQAIKHAEKFRPVELVRFNPDSLDKSLLWTKGDEGDEGNSPIWVLNNYLDLALDAQAAHIKAFTGTAINMWDWHGGINQQWCIEPNGHK